MGNRSAVQSNGSVPSNDELYYLMPVPDVAFPSPCLLYQSWLGLPHTFNISLVSQRILFLQANFNQIYNIDRPYDLDPHPTQAIVCLYRGLFTMTIHQMISSCAWGHPPWQGVAWIQYIGIISGLWCPFKWWGNMPSLNHSSSSQSHSNFFFFLCIKQY